MSGTESLTNAEGLEALAQWSTGARMNDLEGVMWRGDRPPEHSSTGTIIELLESQPDWDRFSAAFVRAVAVVRRLRQVVVEPALPTGPPAWQDDPGFELDFHLRRVTLPMPGEVDDLLHYARVVGETPFDRSRPPWTCSLVALSGGRAAIVLQIHHSLADGAAMIQLMTNMHSDRAEPSVHGPTPEPVEPAARIDPIKLSVDDIAREVRSAPNHVRRLVGGVGRAMLAPGEVLDFVGSLRRVLGPPPGVALSPLHARQRGRAWQFGVLDCSLTALKAAGRAAGGSVNDAYMAALLGGIRIYHEALGVEIDDVPMGMPVSIRRPEDPAGGNRFAGAVLAGPAGERDPAERIAIIRGAVISARSEPALEALSLLSPVLTRVPSAVLRVAVRGAPQVAVSASNIPGIPHPVYVAGARIGRIYALGPLPGASMMATLISYAGNCGIGINADADVYQQPELLWQSMRDGLDEVLDLAGKRA